MPLTFSTLSTPFYETLGFRNITNHATVILKPKRRGMLSLQVTETIEVVMILSQGKLDISAALPFSHWGCCKTRKQRSHPACRLLCFLLGAIGARHCFDLFNNSRARTLILRMLAFLVLLASRVLTFSMNYEVVCRTLDNSDIKTYMIFNVFTRARF